MRVLLVVMLFALAGCTDAPQDPEPSAADDAPASPSDLNRTEPLSFTGTAPVRVCAQFACQVQGGDSWQIDTGIDGTVSTLTGNLSWTGPTEDLAMRFILVIGDHRYSSMVDSSPAAIHFGPLEDAPDGPVTIEVFQGQTRADCAVMLCMTTQAGGDVEFAFDGALGWRP